MDVTPLIPAGRQVVESYGATGFRVSGAAFTGSILVFPDRTEAWGPAAIAAVSVESLAPVLRHGAIELLLVGCGRRIAPLAGPVREVLRQAGIVADAMDTGAACRTYNVLLAEGRRVAAALLPAG